MDEVMNNCGTCKFWKKTTDYKSLPEEGTCSEIGEKVTADVHYGWDGGYIRTYETEEDFCCSLHTMIEKKKAKNNKFDNLSPQDVRESMEASDRAWKED
jgi:hypothetical protein